jgi:multisubunit Na+/H+ antiporter MnhC subunit
MSGEVLSLYVAGIGLTLVCGAYYVLVAHNLVRTIIGLELITKALTLAIILAGHLTGRVGLAQALAITLIVVEVVVMVVAVGIVLAVHKEKGGVDTRSLRNVKG